MDEVMVSICCLAYNHEKYIREALDSFLMQETDFKFEILIHDDASTDNTPIIIREYEKKYPNIIKPIYQRENQYAKGINISMTYQFPRAKGKYIAMCEGDDFWTDKYKLQKQFEAMESNPNCTICTHVVSHVNEEGESLGIIQPKVEFINQMSHSILGVDELFSDILTQDIIPFQTSSFFCRRAIMEQRIKENPAFTQTKGFGDVPLLWYFLAKGTLYFISEEMSNYRTNRVGSWTANYYSLKNNKLKHYQQLINMFQQYDIYTKKKFESSIALIRNKYEIMSYELQGNYQMYLKRRYKNIWQQKSHKEKIYILLCVLIPNMEDIYLKLKNKRKGE